MGIVEKIVQKMANRILEKATKAIREKMIKFVYELEDMAKKTDNVIDDFIVEGIKEEFDIPDRPVEKPKKKKKSK